MADPRRTVRRLACTAVAPLRWASTPSPHPLSRGVAYRKLAVGVVYMWPLPVLAAWLWARLL